MPLDAVLNGHEKRVDVFETFELRLVDLRDDFPASPLGAKEEKEKKKLTNVFGEVAGFTRSEVACTTTHATAVNKRRLFLMIFPQ